MSLQSVLCFEYDFLPPIEVESVDEQVTSDAGLLPIRQYPFGADSWKGCLVTQLGRPEVSDFGVQVQAPSG